MAREKGFYNEVGLDVTLFERTDNVSPVTRVLSGQADFGLADSSIVLDRLNSKPVVMVSTIFQSSPLVLMALKSSGISTTYDLKGKRIMFQKSVDDAPIQALLHMIGLRDEDYIFVPHLFDDWALINDQADVMSVYTSDQPLKYQALGYDVNIIDPSSFGIDFYGDLIFTRDSVALQQPDIIDAFVAASKKGWQYALDHVDETIDVILNTYHAQETREHLREEAEMVRRLIRPQYVDIGTLYPDRFNRIAQTYKDLDMASQNGDLKGFFYSDYGHATTLDRQYLYLSAIVLMLVVGYAVAQLFFNAKLRRMVEVKTGELETVNNVLANSNMELIDAKEAAENANRAKSRFLSNMSHEIRTPVNGVYGILQILQHRNLSDEDRTLVEQAMHSSKSLLTIINDILDYSKIEADKLDLEQVPFSFVEIAKQVLNEQRHNIRGSAISLKIVKEPGYQDGWRGDPVRVRQILTNLVSNAVKFTKQGHVTVHIKHNDKGKLHFVVEDSGIGMTRDTLERLFTRFEQADSSTTRQFGGTGLGLAITLALVEMMQGDINVTSKPMKGSRFSVYLNLPSVDYKKAESKSITAEIPDFEGKTIMIAEDNEINRLVIDSMLTPTKAKLVFANDGLEAISVLRDFTPDVILMDIQMPNLDGVEACKIIQLQQPDVPVVAVTSNVFEDDIKRYREVGFKAHIGKPVDMGMLFKVLGKLL